MNTSQKWTTNIVVATLALFLFGLLGYTTLIKRPARLPIPNTSESISVTPLGENKILLQTIPITFELPKTYVAFQQEGFEGAYGATISFGKEVSAGYFVYAPLEIHLSSTVYDRQQNREYSPRDYIDVLFSEYQEASNANPQYTNLFGNKAVEYKDDSDDSIAIVGYLRANQLPKLSQEYLVTIRSSTYGRGIQPDDKLFNTVVSSLRILD